MRKNSWVIVLLGLLLSGVARAQAPAEGPLLRSLSLTFDTVRYSLGVLFMHYEEFGHLNQGVA